MWKIDTSTRNGCKSSKQKINLLSLNFKLVPNDRQFTITKMISKEHRSTIPLAHLSVESCPLIAFQLKLYMEMSIKKNTKPLYHFTIMISIIVIIASKSISLRNSWLHLSLFTDKSIVCVCPSADHFDGKNCNNDRLGVVYHSCNSVGHYHS